MVGERIERPELLSSYLEIFSVIGQFISLQALCRAAVAEERLQELGGFDLIDVN